MSDIQGNSVDPRGLLDGLAPQDDNIPSQDDEEQYLAGRIRDLWGAADEASGQLTINMNLYLAALYGDSFLAFDPTTGAVYRVLDSEDEALAARSNKLINYARSLWGKLTISQPDFQVQPGPEATLDEIHGARAMEARIQHLRINTDLKQTVDAAKWKTNYSALGGLIELVWNPLGGSKFCYCESCGFKVEGFEADGEPCPQCEQNHQQYQQMMAQYPMMVQQSAASGVPLNPPPQPPPDPGTLVLLHRGGVEFRLPDPRDVKFQPGVKSFKAMRWYVERVPVPVATLREDFPEHALEIYPENEVFPSHGAEYTLTPLGERVNERLQDHAYLYTFTEGPSELHPDGRKVHLVNGRIVGQQKLHYRKFGRLPLFQFGWVPVESTPYFRPPLADAWSEQREYDRLETVQSESAIITGRPKGVVPYGCGVGSDELQAKAGQTVMPLAQYSHLLRYIEPPQLSNDVYARSDKVSNSMREHFGVTIQEVGAVADPNGRYAAIAEAESDQSVGPINRMHNAEEAEMMRCAMILEQYYGDPEEKFAGLGAQSQELYSMQDLKLCAGDQEVSIVPTDGLSSNAALRRQYANELMSQLFFGQPGTPEFDKELFARFAGVKLPGLVPNGSDSEVQAALAAIKQMEDGYGYQPNPVDDAETFVKVLINWLRTTGRRILRTNPTLVQQVTQLHMFYMQQIFMAQQAAMGQGAPPAPGGGPGSTPGNGVTGAGGTPGAMAGGHVSAQAEQTVQNADRAAEGAVRGTQPREG